MKRALLGALVFVASVAHGEIYKWADSRRTTHYTNNMDEIPVRYRAKAKSLAYETEKKADAATPSPQGQGLSPKPEGQPAAPLSSGAPTMQGAPPVPSTEMKGEMPLHQRRQWREYRKSKGRQASQEE